MVKNENVGSCFAGKIKEIKNQASLVAIYADSAPASLVEQLDKKMKKTDKKIEDMTQDGLEIQNFKEKGRGIVTTKPFLKNEFVVEYAGVLMTHAQAKKQEAQFSESGVGSSYMYDFPYKNRKYCVDATEESGRFGRLINHSIDKANLKPQVQEVNEVPRLIIIANRDIEVNEELLFDYGDRRSDVIRDNGWLAKNKKPGKNKTIKSED